MKTFLLSLFTVITFLTFGQLYTEQVVQNPNQMSPLIIEIEKGDPFYILNDNSNGAVKTYILINQTSPTYTTPNVPTGWSTIPLYKTNKSTFNFNLGDTFKIVLDENGCSYLEFH